MQKLAVARAAGMRRTVRQEDVIFSSGKDTTQQARDPRFRVHSSTCLCACEGYREAQTLVSWRYNG